MKNNKEIECCGTCEYFRKSDGAIDGICRNSPIKMVAGSDPPKYSRAVVSAKYWCGAFTMRPVERLEEPMKKPSNAARPVEQPVRRVTGDRKA